MKKKIHLAWFGSEPRGLAEVAAARELMQSSLETAVSRRSNLVLQLARLSTLSAGYGALRISNTWPCIN